MKSIDCFLDRVPTKRYNCLDFAREVWRYLTGEDITDALQLLQGDFERRRVTKYGMRRFRRLERPETPCFVVLKHPYSVPHVGIYLDAKVLHLNATHVDYQPLRVVMLGFQTVRFYK
jgi:hypothetical protein